MTIFNDVWIQRDGWRDVLPPETKHSLVTSLALRLWTSGVEQLHHRELAAYIAETVGAANDPRTLVEIDNELRTASFLVRNAAGEYRFAHKSYAEFFVVGHLVRSLEARRPECLNVPRRLTREHLSFFVDMVREVVKVDEVLGAVVTSDYAANVSEAPLADLWVPDVPRTFLQAVGGVPRPDPASGSGLWIRLPNLAAVAGAVDPVEPGPRRRVAPTVSGPAWLHKSTALCGVRIKNHPQICQGSPKFSHATHASGTQSL